MLIVCPNCKKRFDIDPGVIGDSRKLRCSSCKAVFRLVRKVEGQREVPPPPARELPAAVEPQAPAAVTGAPPAPVAAAPAAPVEEAPVAEAPAVRPAGTPSAESGEVISGRLKVVVANESAAFCEAVRKVLSSEPFEIFICNDGKVALETVERVQPDVLMLDVALPTMFGFEVCERVRQNSALSGVKIVLIASIYDKTRYKRSPNSLYGADDYIEKHHIPDQLVPMVYRLTSVAAPMPQPTPQEREAQEESRSELREAEVRETEVAPEPVAAQPQPEPVAAHPEAEPAPEASPWDELATAEPNPLPVLPVLPVEEPAAPAAPAPQQLPESHVKAKRLARIIVSDIVLYNQGKVEQGVREGNLFQLLADDIREGERLYGQRVAEEVRASTDFLKEAFEDLIAKKRAELRL